MAWLGPHTLELVPTPLAEEQPLADAAFPVKITGKKVLFWSSLVTIMKNSFRLAIKLFKSLNLKALQSKTQNIS